MTRAFIVAAKRTAVVPRGGAFKKVEAAELAAPVFRSLIDGVAVNPANVDSVIMGNALYGGGNPARVAALLAGMPVSVPAFTLDTQCCSGMDAICFAAQQVMGGRADIVLAGGMESYSRAPIRQRRPKEEGEEPQIYNRPPFTPWPDCDPDMLESAAKLASDRKVDREMQEVFAVESHRKALVHQDKKRAEIVSVMDISEDQFTRKLTSDFCKRLEPVTDTGEYSLTAATTAVEADAAAAVLVVSEQGLRSIEMSDRVVEIIDFKSAGSDPAMPALAPVSVAKEILAGHNLLPASLQVVEIMEAFAVQAMSFASDLKLDAQVINRGGGALSRGHPVGASGAINVVRLWHELQSEKEGAVGLAAIAAAGGLGTALLGQIKG